MLSLALADNALEAPSLTSAKRIFAHKVWGPVSCTQLHWKPSMLKVPISRQAVRAADGLVTSSCKALRYSTFKHCINRLGRVTGF
jgi:hypothetical protein